VSSNGSLTVEAVVATVRALWSAVEGVGEAEKVELKQEITDTLNQLKIRVERHLWKPAIIPAEQHLLFNDQDGQRTSEDKLRIQSPPRFTEPTLRVYAKDFADHALQHLPQAVNCRSVEEFRKYLSEKLRFNSLPTRRRAANHIVSRFFPGEVYNDDLPQFAAATSGTPALGEALFYLTCRTERIVSLVAEEVVFPSLAQGGVTRTRIREFVQGKFPNSKSIEDIGQAIIRTYKIYSLGTASRTRLNVSLREGSLASFTYVLHLEFPEPSMYSFEKLFDGAMHKWLLWDQAWMIRQLYRLREAGLISKVSEIDRLRQFTTKYSLADVVQSIAALAKESPE
jgi:DNA repair protein RadC